MKKLLGAIGALAFALCNFSPAQAADSPQKNEVRSAWVATVWRLDWPSTTISSTGNESQISRQKADMTRLLDSLHVNNLNAINFQIRSRCDAMYKSSYEPWSEDLVTSRGMDPGYDPLAFVVEECHKRGMECHAWINPYRYESVVGQWSGRPGDYRKEHPDWIMDVNGASILNPGKPEVTQRICDIIAEIVTNYDLDGVLFDDYFYLSGTQDSQDADLYKAYTAEGGTLSQKDWRRDNVNRMVAAVYKTIKDIKPYVRFGVAPAGIACTSQSVAKQYGITPCPTGSDWQYNDIYSDPIAWVSQQSLDFISPQIYWTIGYSTDYDKATKWWSGVANKWNRHMYVSHSISSLTSSSKMPGMSDVESTLVEPLASGPNNTTFEEYANEIRLNRLYTENEAPGSIFYSCKYLYNNAPLFAHYLKTTVFNTPALMPSMTWFPVSNPGIVSDVQRAGNALSWKGKDNVRYTVYAVPQTVGQTNFNREAEYLMGVSYTENYTIPDTYLSGYDFAVCIYDRYGNEYNPVFVGAPTGTLEAPVLTTPVGGEMIEQPFEFEWESVANATNYIIEISNREDMSELMYVKSVNSSSCSSSEFYRMPIQQKLYWRVRACGNNYNDGVSGIESFSSINLEITYPQDGATDVVLCPEITWPIKDREVTVQISTSADFLDKDIFFEKTVTGSSLTVPKHELAYYSTYYLRLAYVRNGEDCVSPTVTFSTLEGTPETPGIVYPIHGGSLFKNDYVMVTPLEGIKSFRLEISESDSFPARTSYISSAVDTRTFIDSKTGAEIKVNSKNLQDGKEYFIRVRANFANSESTSAVTEYSPVGKFVYSDTENSVDEITADADNAPVTLYSIEGRVIENPSPGIYIEKKGNTVRKVVIR